MIDTKRTIGRQATYVGTHVIAELFDCEKLEDNSVVERAMIEAANRCGGTVLTHDFHPFEPQGLTGYLLLAESHISIHTWPEYGYAAVDAFTCGDHMDPSVAVEYLRRELGAGDMQSRTIRRGRAM